MLKVVDLPGTLQPDAFSPDIIARDYIFPQQPDVVVTVLIRPTWNVIYIWRCSVGTGCAVVGR
jgi:hypothetical protein